MRIPGARMRTSACSLGRTSSRWGAGGWGSGASRPWGYRWGRDQVTAECLGVIGGARLGLRLRPQRRIP